MKIFLGCDHGGFALKDQLIQSFPEHEFIDLGTSSEESVDYPDFANKVCQEVINDADAFGILICGSGQGMAMRANKFPQIRAALCWNEEVAELSRQHNKANVLCLGARVIEADLAIAITRKFLTTDFEGGRHQRRVDKLSAPN